MKKKALIGVFLSFFLFLCLASVCHAQSVTDWPMFRHDPAHSGYSTSSGPTTGAIAWRYSTSSQVYSSPAVTKGVVYFGASTGNVYALNANTGTLIWNYQTSASISSSPAVVDEIVYIGSTDGTVYALNDSTGAPIWSYSTGGQIYSSPVVTDGVLYIGSFDGKVYALDANTGILRWSYATNGRVYSSPAVSGNMVYFGSYDDKVYALNAQTGAFIWSYLTIGYIDSSPTVAGGVVYIGSSDGNIYALNANTGTLIWRYGAGGSVFSSPAVDAGVVYVGSYDGNLYAINANTGALIWRYVTGTYVYSSPAVVDGIVYIGLYNNNIYAINTNTAALVWSCTVGGIVYSPVVVGGVVYVGSYDGYVYAIGLVANISPSSVTLDVGQSQVFISNVLGATGTSSYQWYLDGTPQTGATGDTWAYTPSSASVGLHSVYVKVSNNRETAISNTVMVTANPALCVSLTPISVTLDCGQSQQFFTNASGGSGNLHFQWYLNDSPIPGQTANTYTFHAAASGSPSIYCRVTDSASYPATVQSNTPLVTVNSAISNPIISPSNWIMDIGQTKEFSVSVSGGTGSLHYQWYLDDGIVGSDSSFYSYTAAGTSHSIYCVITDSASYPTQATSNDAHISVSASPTLCISPVGPLTMDESQIQAFTAVPDGGSGAIHYQWYLDGDLVGSDSSSYSYVALRGSHSVTCKATDSASTPMTSPSSNIVTLKVNPQLCMPAISLTYQQQSAILSLSTVTSGTSPYTYQWFSKAPLTDFFSPIIGATSSTYNFLTSSSTLTGDWNFILQVCDGAGASVNSTTVSVTINQPTVDPTPNPSPTPSPSPTPTSSPTSTPTDAPTTDPTTNPTQAPTRNPTQTPAVTPTVPEFSWLAIIPLLVATLFLAVKLRYQKTNQT